MSDTQPPPKDQTLGDIQLEDIDALLLAEDPEFTQSLEEVRAVAPDANITIEASASDDGDTTPESAESQADAHNETRLGKFKARLKLKWRAFWSAFKLRAKERLAKAGKDLVVFLKTRPKEFLLFSIAMSKVGAKNAMVPVRSFQAATLNQRLATLFLVALALASVCVLLANFKGRWLPHFHEPILGSFAKSADWV